MRFYARLGFKTIDTDRCQPLGWARMHCEGGAVMFLRTCEPADPKPQSAIYVMYCPELAALRARLVAAGVTVSAITYPEHMPSGQIDLRDPDGCHLSINHWGDKEHAAWLERVGAGASPS